MAKLDESGGQARLPPHARVTVVGGGFAGIGASITLQHLGTDHVLLERAGELGGTWRDNHYPGCRCDVPSHLYSFSFAPNPDWSETYSPQPEIQDYLRRTAEAHGVTARTLFRHDVTEAAWDDVAQRWKLTTEVAGTTGAALTTGAAGETGERTSDFLILANGPLAEPSIPDLPGLSSFEGRVFHSARWCHDHDLTGRRVAVIGTGASAIQIVPAIQPRVAHLTVFQRTAPWVLPHSNRRIRDWERWVYRRLPIAQRAVREMVYWSREAVAPAMLQSGWGIRQIERLARRHVAKQVVDRELRAKVIPDYRPGCKRLLPSNDWYPAIQQPNVDLVDDKIIGVGPDRIFTAEGAEIPVDTIVLATGFRVTDNPVVQRVRGRDGRTLADAWSETGMRAYLGTTVSGFPNLFMLAGPNTGIGHTSLVYMIEAQLAYLAGALEEAERRGAASVEVTQSALEAFSVEIQAKAARTVWNTGGCASWYLDSEGRNTTMWPDYTFRFRRRTRRFDPAAYEFRAKREARA